MSDNSKIEWTDASWSPIVGCSHASPGCDHCYAEKMAFRLFHMLGNRTNGGGLETCVGYSNVLKYGHWNGKTALINSALDKPLHWKRGRKIFVCSMGDLFHESVPFEWIDKVFAVAALCSQHTFQILTKRPERMLEYLTGGRQEGDTKHYIADAWGRPARFFPQASKQLPLNRYGIMTWPLFNIWLGVTAENQKQADKRIPILLQCPAAVRFVSIEPMLGPVDIERYMISPDGFVAPGDDGPIHKDDGGIGLDWVICGGETGPGARPMHQFWARSVRDQCQAASESFFFKGWGDWLPIYRDTFGNYCCDHHTGLPKHMADYAKGKIKVNEEGFIHVGKKAAGRLLDGREWNEFPNKKGQGGPENAPTKD